MTTRHQEDKILAVAPMMAWTDTHCRVLHRLFSPNALLFTEMLSTGAVLHGSPERLLRFHPSEQPVGCQLGGNDPGELARAARMVEAAGFQEINLNVGCPSPRVQQGRFGACLMAEPILVRDSLRSMRDAVSIPVSVKCRLGIDAYDSEDFLHEFIGTVHDGGCQTFYVHARKAILNGLNPAQNRSVPPLRPERVYNVKQHFQDLTVVFNGGIVDTRSAQEHLARVDGVMIGRAAYHNPRILGELDSCLFGTKPASERAIYDAYIVYAETQLAEGARLSEMTRHLLGMFNGYRGARSYRRELSDNRRLKSGDANLMREAVGQISQAVA